MRPFALWKYIALVLVTAFGLIYAAPNLFGEQPSVQISLQSGDKLAADFGSKVSSTLSEASLTPVASGEENDRWIIRFADTDAQLKASDKLKRALGNDYVVALDLAPTTPAWLSALGAKPMTLGLDLRGGVHFLLEVDINEVRKSTMKTYSRDLPDALYKADIRYRAPRVVDGNVLMDFRNAEDVEAARALLTKDYPELAVTVDETNPLTLKATLTDAEAKRIQDFAIQQNLITLRNRVNQLGVAEPIVQRQGPNRIVVELPGVQDPTRVKDMLGATATLEYRAVDQTDDAANAARTGVVPSGTELYYDRANRPYLLKSDVIASGSQMVDAQAIIDQQSGSPAVSVTLNGKGADKMFEFTSKNVGKPMAVLYKERQVVTRYDDQGKVIRDHRDIAQIISVATIQGVFGKKFQTTGLSNKEAHDLALQLKAGALAAPVDIVEERTVGPSLGADNIKQGFQAAVLGLALVAVFMMFYYRAFGVFAVAALTLNIILVIAGMSIIQATLTMPGIAGMVLTMGIAVDANVLIYERIREELRAGASPHRAIEAGYDRAFLTIADANVTTLIAALILFFMGNGPVKGFAITLALGIGTSQFTAIVGSRALAHLLFAKRARMSDLPIW